MIKQLQHETPATMPRYCKYGKYEINIQMNKKIESAIEHIPIDLDIARTPKTRCPFH